MNYKYDELALADKIELAKYMLDDWEFDDSEESNNSLEREIDRYIEKIANGKSDSFKKTLIMILLNFCKKM